MIVPGERGQPHGGTPAPQEPSPGGFNPQISGNQRSGGSGLVRTVGRDQTRAHVVPKIEMWHQNAAPVSPEVLRSRWLLAGLVPKNLARGGAAGMRGHPRSGQVFGVGVTPSWSHKPPNEGMEGTQLWEARVRKKAGMCGALPGGNARGRASPQLGLGAAGCSRPLGHLPAAFPRDWCPSSRWAQL